MIKTRNGQTIVITGLITDKIDENSRSVPLLGDLPLVGGLFRQVNQGQRKTGLVILMTPYILTDRSIEDIRKEHEERLRNAGRAFDAVSTLQPRGVNRSH